MIVERRIKDFYEKGLGLFIHYGPYVQYEHGEWAMKLRNMDPDLYEKKALECSYSSFYAENLVKAAKAAGARYLTFTARHHDGFSMYDTRGLSEYDVMHTPGGRDILKEWIDACHANDILPFVYLSERKRWASGDCALRLPARQRRGKPDRIPVRI